MVEFLHKISSTLASGKAEVESKIKALDELAFTGIKQLKGIRNIHHMEV